MRPGIRFVIAALVTSIYASASASQAVTYQFDVAATAFKSGALGGAADLATDGTISFVPQNALDRTGSTAFGSKYEAHPFSATLTINGVVVQLIDSTAPQPFARYGGLVQDVPSDFSLDADMFEIAGWGASGAIVPGYAIHAYVQWFGPKTILTDTDLSVENLEKIGINSVSGLLSLTAGSGGVYSASISNLRAVRSAVPSPASWAMVSGGLAIIGASLRRRTLALRLCSLNASSK